MFNIRFENAKSDSLKMGHKQSPISVTLDGIDGIDVDIATSQGFDQIGYSVDNMTVGSRQINLVGKIVNFTPEQLRAVNNMFLPMSYVRMHFEDRYWIDTVIKESPIFSYSGVTVKFAVSLLAPYPYWKSETVSYYKLGGTTGGFNFPVSYAEPHNFGLISDILFLNCYNAGNTKVDFTAEVTVSSGTVTGFTLTNAQNQQFLTVNESMSAGDTVKVYRENNILRVRKIVEGIEIDVFSALDEDSTLFYMNVGDNVIRAERTGGDGILVVAVTFYDTVTGVRYGI